MNRADPSLITKRLWAVLTVLVGEGLLWSAVNWRSPDLPEPLSSPSGVVTFVLAQGLIASAAYMALKLPSNLVPAGLLLCAGALVNVAQGFLPAGLGLEAVLSWLGSSLILAGAVWLSQFSRQLADQRQQLENDATERDALTGLLNRTGFSRRLAVMTRHRPAALVMIDLNDLKGVNDNAGHSAGDQHLSRIAQALQAALPPGALLGRWGGDEFLAALPQATLEQAQMFAAQAAQRSPQPRLELPPFAVGTALMQPREDPARALAVADQQMYEHKARSRSGPGAPAGVYVPSPEEFTRILEGLESKHAILQDGLDALRSMLGFDGSSYYERREELIYPTYVTGSQESHLALMTEQFGRPLSSGIVGQSMLSGSTIGTADYPNHHHALGDWKTNGLKSVIVTPVRVAGQTVGALDLTSYSTWRAITPQVRRLIEAVALRLGHVLEREQVVAQMEQSLEGTLLALGAALEARDVEAYGHTQRVVALSRRLGLHLGLSPRQQVDLVQGAYLHDIGKLTLPDALLFKSGKLSASERLTAQRHVEQGFTLASRISGLSQQALDVILYHHERWDAQGYLAGYGQEDIPLLARVFAVCDAYDLLTSARPDKPAWPASRALSELRAQAGKQFDPAVVDAFLTLMSLEPQLD